MPKVAKPNSAYGNTSTATVIFEAGLWITADNLRTHKDAAEYTHVVLDLILFK